MKRIVAVMLILTMVFAFAGCNKDSDPTLEPDYSGEDSTKNNNTLDLSQFEGKYFEPYAEMLASGNYYCQLAYESDDNTIRVTYYSINGDEQVVYHSSAKDSNDVLLSKIDGKYYMSDGQGYIEIGSDFNTTYPDAADTVDSLKSQMASIKAEVQKWLTSFVATSGVQVTLDGVAYHEEYILGSSGLVYSMCFDENKALFAYIAMDPDSTTNASETYNFVIGDQFSANQITGIFQLKNYAESETVTTAE